MADDMKRQGSEHWYDPSSGATILNETSVSSGEIANALSQQHPELATLIRWGVDTQTRSGSIFERDRYATPDNIYDQMRLAYRAAQEDDVVSGVLDTTESLAFAKMDFESEDPDEEDVWNQIAGDLDLDARLREMWRELFTVSQFYVVSWWGVKTYKVGRVVPDQPKRKKTFARLKVPTALSLLDPLKVVPVGNLLFGQEKLAYIATEGETKSFKSVLESPTTAEDLAVLNLISRKYEPDEQEAATLSALNINPNNLFLLNEERVWRHTATRAAYERFSPVRMKGIFDWLDLKTQLKQMDRAHLIGGTNFIVLVKKGSDEYPARPQEITGLAAQVKMAARVPVIVGDHRLEIQIITPKLDVTLNSDKYDTIDTRIEARLFQMFMTGRGKGGAKGDDSIKVARVVARGLESRRHMMRRTIEANLVDRIYEANKASFPNGPAKLMFHPKRVALDFDPAVATFLQDLRDRGDISRETVLDEMNFSQYDEARKRIREKEFFDDIFQTQVPFSAPAGGTGQPITPQEKKAAGRNGGGNRNGGGSNPDSKTPNSSPVRPKQGDND